MIEIVINGEVDKDLIAKIQQEYYKELEGIYEIYDGLYTSGKCRTYNKTRGFYVAYTLAANNIDVKINEI